MYNIYVGLNQSRQCGKNYSDGSDTEPSEPVSKQNGEECLPRQGIQVNLYIIVVIVHSVVNCHSQSSEVARDDPLLPAPSVKKTTTKDGRGGMASSV